MRAIRWVLGKIILFIDELFTPKVVQRETDEEGIIDEKIVGLSLYQYEACPFCVKVRRMMKRNGLNIPTRDAKRNEQYRQELLTGGGRLKVPCLRIEAPEKEDRWLYESNDIIHYLETEILEQNSVPAIEQSKL